MRRPPPAAPPRGDARLVAVVDRAIADAADRSGARLRCPAGCADCCIGPFPITRLDASRLRRGLLALARTEPERAAALRRRAGAATARLAEGFPGDAEAGVLGSDDEAIDGFLARHAALPCPALDPATRRCELYDHRPISCRTYGLPVRIGRDDLPPCPLGFPHASHGEEERGRSEIDPEGIEDRLLARMDGGGEETLVAFALGRSRERSGRRQRTGTQAKIAALQRA